MTTVTDIDIGPDKVFIGLPRSLNVCQKILESIISLLFKITKNEERRVIWQGSCPRSNIEWICVSRLLALHGLQLLSQLSTDFWEFFSFFAVIHPLVSFYAEYESPYPISSDLTHFLFKKQMCWMNQIKEEDIQCLS